MIIDSKNAESTLVLKKGSIFDLLTVLNKVGSISDSAKFSYFVAKNVTKLKIEAAEIHAKIYSHSPKFVEFDKLRVQLNEIYSTKDDAGKPIITNTEYVIDSSQQKEFETELDALKKEYQSVLEEENDRIQIVNAYLNQPIETEFYTIKLSQLSNKISADDVQILMSFIEED